MIHIVFQEDDVAVLNEAIGLDASLDGAVKLIRDDYAVGPINNLYTPDGIAARKEWWREVLAGGDLDGSADAGMVDDQKMVEEITTALLQDEEEVIWIWAAQNKHDVCGYYWLMSQLGSYQGRIFILYLNNLPFFNAKGGIFYPDRLAVIPATEFLKAKKLARPITPSEFEVDPDEWLKLGAQEKYVRLLEGGKKLAQQDVDYYDATLKKYISGEWQKAGRIIAQFLHKSGETTGDMYLLWRLKHISREDGYEVQGEMKGLKDFEIKNKTANTETI